MPIYEYRCENGHVLEVMQRMTEDALEKCSTCGAPVQRVFHPVAVHFKGSGFYSTDYGKAGASKPSENGGGPDNAAESKQSDSGSSESKSGESKSKDGGSKSSGSKASPAGTASSD